MLEAIDLTKAYGSHVALDRLTLTIAAGEVFCLLGANGAGKTTTINLFLNFIQPTAGVARIKGIDVVAEPIQTKRLLGYIPEQVMLYRNLSGLENLEYFTALASRECTTDELRDLLAKVGLSGPVAAQRVGTYSKGMRQKVGIAIAMAKQAEVLLLDEPASGLDPKAANEFSELLRHMSEGGVAVLMTTHDLFRAKETGTRIGIMKHGRLVAVHAARELSHRDLERVYIEHMRE